MRLRIERATKAQDDKRLEQNQPGGAQPEHAWKALSLTNEWVRHADAKVGVTLAFVAATAAALLNLVKDHKSWTCWLVAITALGSSAIVAAVVCAGLALFPRVKDRKRSQSASSGAENIGDEEAVNLLFFGDVHRAYGSDRPTYREVLSLLTSDPDRLTRHIADQIHANARIATVKFRFVNLAIGFGLIAATALGAAAVLIAKGW